MYVLHAKSDEVSIYYWRANVSVSSHFVHNLTGYYFAVGLSDEAIFLQ